MASEALIQSSFVKFPNAVYDEREYTKYLCGAQLSEAPARPSLSAEVAKARQLINDSLASAAGGSSAAAAAAAAGDSGRMEKLEVDNKQLKQSVQSLTARVAELEKKFAALAPGSAQQSKPAAAAAGAAAAANANAKEDDDDDIDLFGSDDDDDDAEAEKLKQERLKAYQEKKAKKPALVAKSNIILDVKPWDDETDMGEMERVVRSVAADGLLWGNSKLVPLAYGIKKLQISCVVEDDKVGTDFLEEEITKFEDLVQSVDVAAFQKI